MIKCNTKITREFSDLTFLKHVHRLCKLVDILLQAFNVDGVERRGGPVVNKPSPFLKGLPEQATQG